MPLFYKANPFQNDTILGVWEISEDDDFFLEHLVLYDEEKSELSVLKSRKRTEWLASRYLLHLLSGRNLRGACLKDEFGKPYLKDSSFKISMSHSGEFTAVMAAPENVGVDIQKPVAKIERIATRFLSPEEYDQMNVRNRLEMLHVYWGAKESLYKAFGRKSLDFRKHIIVDPFEYNQQGFEFSGRINNDHMVLEYRIFYQPIENAILVYAVQS
ncbi:MAG: 4'-phosphopantetheinyl transferase superfamily protein [Saprospiraceae bacterium]|nr:4'-phosphopantetheinyl transferase superfamily protein [Saprospiraceae bacterium]